MLVVMTGLQATGKTYVAERLAQKMSAALVGVDPIESAMVHAGLWRNQATDLAAYFVAQSIAKTNVALGQDVIVDGAHYQQQTRDLWTQLAEETQTDLVFLLTTCSDSDEHHRRVADRRHGLPGVDKITWNDVIERNMNTAFWGNEPRMVVDTAHPVDIDHIAMMVACFGGETEQATPQQPYRPARRALED